MSGPFSSPLASVAAWLLLAVLVVHAALALVALVLTRRAEAAHPPTGRFVETADGTRLHYRESGPADAPVLVLVHGASTSLLDFETSLRPPLEGRFRVVAVDRPGSGWSEPRRDAAGDPLAQAALVVRVLDALGIERATWVGHSWGGAVVMAALLEHADRVEAAVAISAATHPWEGPLPRVVRLGALPLVGPLFAATWVEPLGRFVLADGLKDSFAPESPPMPIEAYREATGADLTIRPAAFLATARDMTGLPPTLERLAPRYASIGRPLLLINGSADPVVPRERNAARVLEVLPDARSLVVEGAGHIVHHTHAERVARAIAAFAEEAR